MLLESKVQTALKTVPPGRFGIDCEGTCDCPKSATCDVVNGTCYEATTVYAITTGNIFSTF